MHARFVSRVELVPGIWEYTFAPERQLDYIAGQYVDFRLPNVTDDPRGDGRTFTLTSLPTERPIRFVCRHDEPASAYKQVLLSLKEHTSVQLGGLMGDLVLPKLPTVPLIFVAGGIGMASFTAMLKQLIQNGETRQIHLFYSLRTPYEDAFQEQINAFPFTAKQRFIANDRVSVNDIARVATSNSLIYLSGSQKFVIGLSDALHTLGFGHEQVIFDYYDGYTEL